MHCRYWMAQLGALWIAACAGDDGSNADASGSSGPSSGAESGGSGSSDTGSTTVVSTTQATTTATGGSSSSADSGTDTDTVGCVDPQPIMQTGDPALPTGYELCDDGTIRRVASAQCADPLPGGPACKQEPFAGGCESDAECTDQPHGRCVEHAGGAGITCGCDFGCAGDADCGEDRVCACGGSAPGYPIGSSCIAAGCATAADCGEFECALGEGHDACYVDHRVACHTAEDACQSPADCVEKDPGCVEREGVWQCTEGGPCA